MKLLITGGTGFFGKSLLSYFSENNPGLQKIILLSRHPEKLEDFVEIKSFPFEIKYIAQDIREPIKFHEPVDYIIHAATESSTSVGSDNPMLIQNVVVEGAKNVLEYAIQQKVKRVLFISSGAVYGKQPSDLSHIPEDYTGAPNPLNPLNAYGCAKRQAENLCTLYHHHYRVDYIVARCFAFVGPYLPLDAHFAIGNFISDGLNGGPIIIKGDGTTVRSYLYADDLADWLWMIIIKGKTGAAYNIGSDEAITINDLAHLVSSCFKVKPEVKIIGKKTKTLDRYVPSIQKIKGDLGVKQKISLEKAIINTINFYNNN